MSSAADTPTKRPSGARTGKSRSSAEASLVVMGVLLASARALPALGMVPRAKKNPSLAILVRCFYGWEFRQGSLELLLPSSGLLHMHSVFFIETPTDFIFVRQRFCPTMVFLLMPLLFVFVPHFRSSLRAVSVDDGHCVLFHRCRHHLTNGFSVRLLTSGVGAAHTFTSGSATFSSTGAV